MARKLSRRTIARYAATQLTGGASQKEIAQQLAAHLIETRRTTEAGTIIRDIAHHLAEAGYVEATVTSAHVLEASVETALKELVQRETGASEVAIAAKVDPDVLGGVKVETPGRTLDATVAHKLHVLKTRYKKA